MVSATAHTVSFGVKHILRLDIRRAPSKGGCNWLSKVRCGKVDARDLLECIHSTDVMLGYVKMLQCFSSVNICTTTIRDLSA